MLKSISRSTEDKPKYTKIVHMRMIEKINLENIYEIPLLEHIVRKGWGKLNKRRVDYDPNLGYRYDPSPSYYHALKKAS